MERWTVDDRIEISLEGLQRIRVRLVAGEVSVTAGEGPARVEVTRVSGPEIRVRFDGEALEITHGESGMTGLERLLSVFRATKVEAHVALVVPASTVCDLGTVSAAVIASGLAARAFVKTVSGDVTLDSIAETLDVKTVSGEVQARRVTADLKAKTVSGSVSVVGASGRWVEARTVSGDVTLDLELHPSGHYDLVTVSGNVSLRTVAEPSVVVDAQSVSGAIRSDFGLEWGDDKPGRRRVRAHLGDGEARLSVKTVSGDLRIVRRREVAA